MTRWESKPTGRLGSDLGLGGQPAKKQYAGDIQDFGDQRSLDIYLLRGLGHFVLSRDEYPW